MRAEPGNSETAQRIAAAGWPYLQAPMLQITPTGETLPALDRVRGLLFTSANGVRAYSAASDRRDLTAWCVGPATLAAAKLAGFTDLEHADGNSEDLARLVIAKADVNAGALLHVANRAAVGHLATKLRAAGFHVGFAPLYEAIAADTLPEEVVLALQAPQPCVILIHSAKGAAAFARLADTFDLSEHFAVCVSQAAAEPLLCLGFQKISWAVRPNEESVLATVFSAYSTL